MANFNSEVISSHHRFDGMSTNRIYQDVNNEFEGRGYNVVGINTNEISNMKQAIDTYIANIEDKTKAISDYLDASTMFKGSTVETEVKGYVDIVFNYISRTTNELRYFKDKLAAVEQAWLESTQQMASKVTSGSSEISQSSASFY